MRIHYILTALVKRRRARVCVYEKFVTIYLKLRQVFFPLTLQRTNGAQGTCVCVCVLVFSIFFSILLKY